MSERGLRDAENPSALFMLRGGGGGDGEPPVVGSAVGSVLEGTRAMCAEVQALCVKTHVEYPRHRTTGLPLDRVFMLLAVLSKHAGILPFRNDVFVSVVGGLRTSDPAVDLAATVAVASSITSRPVRGGVALIGEVGLGGELRPVAHVDQRIGAAKQMGFSSVIVPAARPGGGPGHGAHGGMRIAPHASVVSVLRAVLLPRQRAAAADEFGDGREEPDERRRGAGPPRAAGGDEDRP